MLKKAYNGIVTLRLGVKIMRIEKFIEENKEAVYGIIKELCAIPAPSHFEHERAAYCKKWLEANGANGVYIDDAQNVIFPLGCEGSEDITVICAHTDTVFPDREPMPYHDDGEKIYSPGVADDTASVAVLLLTVKYFLENHIVPKKGILFCCNASEEGLGNLKGTKTLFASFAGRIGKFITYDSSLNCITNRCVGSHRYQVEVLTEGGHSFSKFGNANAIACLSRIISDIYAIKVPEKEGAKTTYNVGTIMGGTSINTIAQSASMLCEYRSNDKDCLRVMQEKFEAIFEAARSEKVQVNVQRVGDRPCSDIDFALISALEEIVVPIIKEVTGEAVTFNSASTDCNVPLSQGIPALCIGVNNHGGAHTREEWLDKASVLPGLMISIKSCMQFAEVEV